MRSLIRFIVVFGILGGAAYAGWYFLIKEEVQAKTPAEKECVTEKAMVQEAIDKAVADRQTSGLDVVDPSNYIHEGTRKYYNFGPADLSWTLLPIGAPPC